MTSPLPKHVLCVWLPNWPIQRLVVEQPELSFQSILLYRQEAQRGQRLVACSSAALAAGVRVGMSLAEASGLVKGRQTEFARHSSSKKASPSSKERQNRLRIEEHDPIADRSRLEHLAATCDAFSPLIGIEQVEQPECLYFDTTGLEQLFGDQQGLALMVTETFRRWGYIARIAVAANLAQAWAVAHYGAYRWQRTVPLNTVPLNTALNTAPNTAPPNTVPPNTDTFSRVAHNAAQETSRTTVSPTKLTESIASPPSPLTADAGRTALPWSNQPTGKVPLEEEQAGNASPEEDRFDTSTPQPLAGLFEPLVVTSLTEQIDGLPSIIRALPIVALRTEDQIVRTLQHLGVERIEQLLEFPRGELAARFPKQLLLRIDQLQGDLSEPIVAWRVPAEFRAVESLEYPTVHRETVREISRRLLEQVCRQMQARRQGALRLECLFRCEDRQRATIQIGLFEPTAGVRHLMDLLSMQLERLQLRRAVQSITVEVLLNAPWEPVQYEFFEQERQSVRRELGSLLNRLSCRLGRRRVLQVMLQQDPHPERSFRLLPLTGRELPTCRSSPKRRAKQRRIDLRRSLDQDSLGTKPRGPAVDGETHWVGKSSSRSTQPWEEWAVHGEPASRPAELRTLDRPIHLLPEPYPLTVQTKSDATFALTAFLYQQRNYRLQRHWGPERIETGWWRGPAVRRDYYRVEVESGERFWIFQDLEDQRWYLQGLYA